MNYLKLGYWVKIVIEARDSCPIREVTTTWLSGCNFSSLCLSERGQRPVGTLDRPNCLVSRVIYYDHSWGSYRMQRGEVWVTGQQVGNVDLRWVLVDLEVKLGWLVHIRRADVCVCLGLWGLPLGWDGRTHCNFHLICCCPHIMILFLHACLF